MKKPLLFVAALTIVFIMFLGSTGLLDYSNLPISNNKLSQSVESSRQEIDEVDFQAAAIKRNTEDLTKEIDQEMSERKKELIEKILVSSDVVNYQKNITNSIKGSLGNEAKDSKKRKMMEQFAQSLMDYPLAAEFQEIISQYSEKELDYLLNNIEHPANQQAMAIQKERVAELTEVTKSEKEYMAAPEKREIIDDIVEASNALEHGMVIGDATTKPIFMAIHKKQNPEANIQEMEAFANKLIETTRPKQAKAMNNAMYWSFDQVDKDKLENYRRFVNQEMDRKINDKYLEDMKKFYGDYGKYIGEELVAMLEKTGKGKASQSPAP